MTSQKRLQRALYVQIGLILLCLGLRFLFNKYQFDSLTALTPVGALLLLAGSEKKSRALLLGGIVLGGMIVCDVMINTFIYDGKYGMLGDGWYMNYLLFAGLIWIAFTMKSNTSALRFGLGAVVVSLVFWLASDAIYLFTIGTNIITGEKMPVDLASYAQVLKQGFPFARNFFAGSLAYGVFFMAVQSLFAKPVVKGKLLYN